MENNEKIKNAFIKASDLRIGLVLDDDYWGYTLENSEKLFGYKTLWENFQTMLSSDFNNDIDLYNAELLKLHIVFKNMADFLNYKKKSIKKEMYNETLFNFVKNKSDLEKKIFNKRYYLSIDLKNAIFQCLEYFNCCEGKTFDEFIKTKTDYPQLLDLRGNKLKCWDEVTMKIGQQALMRMGLVILSLIYDTDHPIVNYVKENLDLAMIRTDELLFAIGDENDFPTELIEEYCGKDCEIGGFVCHINILQYGLIHYKINGEEMYKTYYDDVLTGKRKINAKNCLYMWQLNKLYNEEKLTDKDKVIRDGSGYLPFTYDIEIIRD